MATRWVYSLNCFECNIHLLKMITAPLSPIHTLRNITISTYPIFECLHLYDRLTQCIPKQAQGTLVVLT